MTHFKSVVDAREARLGCGIKIKPGDRTYVVAHYSSRPGQKFKLNDFTPSEDVQIRKQPGNKLAFFHLIPINMQLNLPRANTLWGPAKERYLPMGA